jgi:hypothetical protein
MKPLSKLFLASTILLVWGCGDDRSAGISFETENVSAGAVIDVDSIAPPAQRLGWYPYVATVRLDTSMIDIDSASAGANLVVEQMDRTPVAFAIQRWVPAEGWARILVRIEGDLLAGGRKIVVRNDDKLLYNADPDVLWAWIPDTLRTAWTSVLLDDFEHGALTNLLPNQAAWSTKRADSARMTEPTLVPAGSGRTGTAMRFEYDAPLSRNDFVLFQTTTSPRPVNFGGLDSIVFWARGTGILSLSLDRNWNGASSKTWMHDDLDTVWTRWRVRPQDFDPPGEHAGNKGWDSVHDSITHITFFATGSGFVMIDDIRIFGLNKDDFR